MEFLWPILEIAKFIGTPICKYLKYHKNLDENLKILKRILKEELSSQKEDIELRLSTECLSGKVPKKEVENWLQNVQRINSEISLVEEKANKGKYFSRASLGKQVEEKIQQVKEFQQKGSSFNILVVDAATRGVTLSTTTLVGESTTKKNLKEIWDCLMGDEVRKIGVCGMGGVGKTTIMKLVNNKLLEETDKFNNVIWVTVSQQPNLAKLQNNIVTALKKDPLKEEDVAKRAKILLKILEDKKRYVLILDDLWEAFPLEVVGIPEPTREYSGCKLVITTRSIEVCRSMGCKVVQVEPLSKEEALSLFLDKVGHEVLQIPTLEKTVNLIVEQCIGLPLAIVTIASSMKGVNDVHEWRNALNELCEQVKSVKGMESKVFVQLQFNYNRLKDQKVQYCFLYCALYPEDFEIPKNKLIEYWIDEGLIDEMETRVAMHDRGHAILNRLENNYLLERVEDGEYVKMHDLVRDMALRITSVSPRFMIKAGIQLQEFPPENEWRDIEKVSLMKNSITKIPSNISSEFQTLSTLWLQKNPLKMIPESFFAKMVRLEILDLSDTNIKDLPTSIFDLKNLTTLLLGGCNGLRNVPNSISKFQALKKLVLHSTSITEVPQGMAKLKNLRYLDLRTYKLKKMPVGLLPELSRLQYLTFNTWSDTIFIKPDEVAQLRKLETFEGKLYDVHELNKYVKSLPGQKGFNQYYLQVGQLSVGASYGRCVTITGFSVSGDSLVLPTNIQQLNIIGCDDVRSLSNISSLKVATDLRCCNFYMCEAIEYVFSLSSFSAYSSTRFQTLERLELYYLGNLRILIEEGEAAIVSTSQPPTTTPSSIFSHLGIIIVSYCPKIKKLFWPGLLQDLQNLEVISVSECEQMEEIIADDREEENHKEKGTDAIITFSLPKLRTLDLDDLPELKSICSKRGVMVCDSLQQIRVCECPKLKRMPFSLPLLDKGEPSPLPFLKKITAYPKEWWESVEWDHPNAKNVLPFCDFSQ